MKAILKLYIGIFLFLLYGELSAQELIVSGRVTETNGEGLPGVTIRIKNEVSNGTITDIDGRFSLQVSEGQYIIISYIGFESQEIEILNDNSLSIELMEDIEQLEEVVVVGYGTQKKSDLTGATAVISSKDVDLQPLQRVENVLQGKVAGVTVQQNSGAPGSAPKVNIRGFTGEPTYVIDGFIDADINAINPNDIETISVLKDASATAIYGSRGANGVILITTKNAKAATPFTASGEYYHTISQLQNQLDLLDAATYMQVVNKKLEEGGASERFTRQDIEEARANPAFGTDWQDEIFRTAHSDNLNLNLSKGWENSALRVSLGARKDQGIVLNSGYERYAGRLNFNTSITSKTKLQLNGGYTLEKTHNIAGQNGMRNDAANPVVAAATSWSPNLSIFDPVTEDYQGFVGYGTTVRRNPVYQAREVNADADNNIFNGGITLSHEIIKYLTAKASYGIQLTKSDASTFRRFEPATPGSVSQRTSSDRSQTNQQWNLQLNYAKTFGENHQFSATAVAEVLDREFTINRFRNTYNEDETPGETVPDNDPFDFQSLGQVSYLSRVNYDFKDKILITGSIRIDASSRLPKNNRWDDFYSGAIAYRISDEPFLANIDQLEGLKLRVGYGEVGAINSIGFTQIQSLTNPDINGYAFSGNTVEYAEAFPDNANRANPDLLWETSKTWNSGFDLILWEGKIELNFDYYQKFTEGAHFNQPVPSFFGGGSIRTNSGEFKNSGVELNIIHQWEANSDLKIRTSFNMAFNESEVLQLPSDSLFTGNTENGFEQQSHILIEGQQLGQLWGYQYLGSKVDGASPLEGEVPSAQVGDAIYFDRNRDGEIDIADMTVLGNGHPDFTWGFNTFIDYKNFSLNVFVQGLHGLDAYNLPKHGLLGGGAGVLDATSVEILNSSSFPVSVGDGSLPSLLADFQAQSSLFVEDASFVRVQNIALGYNFSESIRDKLKLSQLRIYAAVQNLITITDYTGYDPESKSGSNQAPGIDRGSFPVPRTYTVGLNFGF